MHSTQTMLTSACGLRCIGHVRMTDATRDKLSKVGMILLRDCHAKLHVIAGVVASVHGEACNRAASNELLYAMRNGPPRTQESCMRQQSW